MTGMTGITGTPPSGSGQEPTSTPLVTITGDGTFRAPAEGSAALEDAAGEPRLAALLQLRGLLGDDPEEQIGARLYLPAALGTEPADQLLPASLALLSGTTGDLASYGWRLGTGAGLAWHHARELRERTLDAARIALLGYAGQLVVTSLGPLTLAAATFLASGERTLADRGALRDLPHVLAEGITEHLAAVRDRVPGAQPRVLLREDAATAVLQGRIPAPSGYRRYPALAGGEIGPLWQSLREALETGGLPSTAITLALPPQDELLQAATSAGIRSLAIAPARIPGIGTAAGRLGWERLAELRESGVYLQLTVRPDGVEGQLDRVASAWHDLGYAARELAGFTLVGHRSGAVDGAAGSAAGSGGSTDRVGPRDGENPRHRSDTARPTEPADPADEPGPGTLLRDRDLERLLRAAPAWAERTGA